MHDPKPEAEWKDNFDSWPLNIDMQIGSPVSIDKTQKRTTDTSGTIDMEEGLLHSILSLPLYSTFLDPRGPLQ